MSTSPPPSSPNARAGARRKSGRVVQKPDILGASSPAGTAKRKRAERDEEEDVDVEDASEEDVEESEGEPDEEEIRERRRKVKKSKGAARKPATKKARPNGDAVSLAIRPATGKGKRARKAKPQHIPVTAATAEEAGGLYGKRMSDSVS